MTTIAIDGMNEEEFRRSIESRMRHGLAAKAADQLRVLLAPFAGPGGILPPRFLTVTADDLSFNGWDALGDAIHRHDRPGRPVTALSIAFGWPGEDLPQPDDEGRLSPLIEIGYYTDDAFPFSQSSREDLLDGYSFHGCTWTGDCEATDNALWLSGIDDLHGALALLEARLLASDEPDEQGIRAGSLGASLLSVLLYQAVDARIAQGGLSRPLCVMAGSSGVYPYFDAPVAGFPDEARKAAEAEEDEVVSDAGVPAPRYSSLLVTGIPRARKRAVLVLEETADEEASRISRLRGLSHGETIAEPVQPEPLPEVPAPDLTEVVIAAVPDSPLLAKKPSGQSWDFREMLSTYEPEADLHDEQPLELEPELERDWDSPAPLDPELDRGGPEPLELEQEWDSPEPLEPEQDRDGDPPPEPEPDWGFIAPPEPAVEPLPALSGSGGEASVGPGFSLLDALRLERPQTLFPLPDFHTVEEEDDEEEELAPPAIAETEPAALPVAEPEPELAFELSVEPEQELEPEHEPEPEPIFLATAEDAAAESAPPAWPSEPTWLREVEARVLPKAPGSEPVPRQPAHVELPVSKSLLARLSDWWNGRR